MYTFLFLLFILFSASVLANPACVVCTVAIGTTLSIASKLGVDNCVVGVWTGAFLAVMGYWLIRFFEKRNWNFPFRDFILMNISIFSVCFIYISQLKYSPTIIGFLYLDSFLFANIIGALVFIGGMHFYEWLKFKNNGHAHFPFEKVVLPFLIVAATSWGFHVIDNCGCKDNEDTMQVLPLE